MPNTKKTEITEDELAAKRDRLAELRQELADVEAARVASEREMTTQVVAAQLDAEEQRLLAQLAQAKQLAKASAPSSATPLQQAESNRDNAEAARKAVEEAVKAQADAAKNKES